MMGVRKDYKRWDYDDETEITMEEQLTLEENPDSNSLRDGTDSLNSSSFPPPNIVLSSSPIRNREVKRSRKHTTREKAQLIAISSGVILLGFIAGFLVGVRERDGREAEAASRHSNKHHLQATETGTSGSSSNAVDSEGGAQLFRENTEFYREIKGENIRHSMQRMCQEEHQAGTPEGRRMAYAIRDMWRQISAPSVRIEQHKTLITRTESFNYVEVLDSNETVVFTTSKIGDDVNLPNSKPIVAFSPSGNCSGTLIYGHHGSLQDLQLLKKIGIPLNESIALIRYGTLPLSAVVTNAMAFGLKGIIFYPDPQDFGPFLPSVAVRRASLLTVGQVQEFQKHKGKWGIPCHTISSNDARKLLGTLEKTTEAPKQWQGGLGIPYNIGGGSAQQPTEQGTVPPASSPTTTAPPNLGNGTVRLRVFNEQKLSTIYNVIAAIPGSVESDRYIILGCGHDTFTLGASIANSLALSTELLRVFSSAVAAGWKPRRSILFISWDANLHAASGVSHWLQEHYFEVMSRTVAYIDLARAVQGNETLQIFSSPLLKEVVRKAIGRGGKHSHLQQTKAASSTPNSAGKVPLYPNVQWNAAVSSDEASFAFLGSLGIPFIHLSVTNSPKGYDYPLFHTAFDSYDNFVKLVDPNFKGSETIARVMAHIILLLSDSSVLPITLQDYTSKIKKEMDHFLAEFQEDFHKANLSLAYLQAAMTRLEIITNNFKAEIHNHSKGATGNEMLDTTSGPHHNKLRREMYHRMLNDKFMLFEKALLTQNPVSDGYRHQFIGYASWLSSRKSTLNYSQRSRRDSLHTPESTTPVPKQNSSNFLSSNNSSIKGTIPPDSLVHRQPAFSSLLPIGDIPRVFPELRVIFECGRNCERGLNQGEICSDFFSIYNSGNNAEYNCFANEEMRYNSSKICETWKKVAEKSLENLVRALKSTASVIQSPLVPTNRE